MYGGWDWFEIGLYTHGEVCGYIFGLIEFNEPNALEVYTKYYKQICVNKCCVEADNYRGWQVCYHFATVIATP